MRRRTAGMTLAVLAGLTVTAVVQNASAALTPALRDTGPKVFLQDATPPDISVANIQAHLTQLNTIATSNGGNRRAGSNGHTQSIAYLKGKLQAAGYAVTEQTCTGCTYRSNNLIADWPGGPTDQVTMFGAHLDSVSAGPGINDNGSGSATLLENALVLAQRNPTLTRHVRFAWWTGEEQGLQGSKFYVNSLTAAQKSTLKAYYNFDMVASPNGGYFINNLNSAAAAPLKAYWDSLNLQPEEDSEGVGRSDDYPFQQAGIPTSAYATGADWTKTAAQAQKWGGTAGRAYDSCYHQSCDTTGNINTTALDNSADGIAYTIWKTSVGDSTPGGCTAAQLIANGGFENGTAPWTTTPGVVDSSSSQPAHSGSYKAWLDGYGSSHTDSATQSVTLPGGCASYTLSFYLHIDTAETTAATAYDKLTVQVGSATLATYSNLDAASGYAQKTINLSAYAGQTVTLKLTGTEDAGLQTSFVIDDVALQVA